MGLLATIAASLGFGIKSSLRFEAVDVNGRYWTGTFFDVQAYGFGLTEGVLVQWMKNKFYYDKGVRLRYLKILGKA